MQPFLLCSLFIILFAAIASGIPVIFALFGASTLVAIVAVALGAFDPALVMAVPERIYGVLENQILYAIPLFLLMGKILDHSGLAERALFTVSGLSKSRNTHSLCLAVILVSLLIACSSGVVGATITMLAAFALPVLNRAGVNEKASAGLIVASGSLGQIVPPSIVLILLSDQISNAHLAVQQSAGNFSPEPVTIAHLFAGAMIPGILLALAYAARVLITIPKQEILESGNMPTTNSSTQARLDVLGLVSLIGLAAVPAAILLGIATATEAACLGAAFLLTVAFASGRTGKLRRAFQETIDLTGVIFGIVLAASVFALTVRGLEGDRYAELALHGISSNPDIAVLVTLGLIFVLGFILEFVEITYIIIPIAAPVVFTLGVDPLWFAILVGVNLQISFLTPPMGVSLFYFKSVSPISPLSLYRAVIPYVGLQLLVLALIFLVPAIATWLPAVLI